MDLSTNSPFWRAAIVTVPGLVLALYIASELGAGNFSTPILFLVSTIVILAVFVLTKQIRFEAVVLGFLLFGYIVGQGGFAHFSLSERSNIYFGELGMMACAGAYLARVAFTREKIIPRQPLAWAILLLIIAGVVRVSFDLAGTNKPMVVIRDFATIYYAAFFFIAYNVCKHPPSRLFLQRVLTFSLVTLIITYFVWLAFATFFNHFQIRGRPLIELRSDLTGSFMSFACVYFFLQQKTGGKRMIAIALGLAAFVLILVAMSRATFVGLGAAIVLLIICRKTYIVSYLALFSVIAGLTLAVVGMNTGSLGEETIVSRLTDKAMSLVAPFTGTKYEYAGVTGDVATGNNRFRETWWNSVINETMEKSPLTGLGFGYDLAKRFLQTYNAPLNQYEFDARSPHSIILTIFGRMGLVGILSLTVIVYLILRSSIRCAMAVRKRKIPAIYIAPWCGVIAIFATACFGVMLEGPMAAIVFWSLLGLSALREVELKESKALARAGSTSLRRLPALEQVS